MQQIRKARYRYAVENQGHSPSPRDLALPSYMSGTVTKNGVDMY